MNTHELADYLEQTQGRHLPHDYAPDATSPLTKNQKWRLSELARKAWINRGRPGKEADFRREEAIAACGMRISAATQRQWAALKAHFQDMAGQPGPAFRTLIRDNGNAKRVAMHKLEQACRQQNLALGYAAAICRTQNRCELADASAPQIWRLVFTINNRGRAKQRKTGSPAAREQKRPSDNCPF